MNDLTPGHGEDAIVTRFLGALDEAGDHSLPSVGEVAVRLRSRHPSEGGSRKDERASKKFLPEIC